MLPFIGLSLSVGCAAPSTFRLEQPHLREPQQRLNLLSEQVYWTAEGPTYRMLAEIPLPGAGTGRPGYLLYLRVTTNSGQKAGSPQAAEVRGFLIQTRGPQAGLTQVTKAGVGDVAALKSGQTSWKLHVDLTFEDSSRLSGDLVGTRDDWRLKQFETRSHAADVQALLNGPVRVTRD